MRLSEFLIKHNISQHSFALKIGVSSMAVNYYYHNKKTPSKKTMERIITATNGEVSPNDFYKTDIVHNNKLLD